MNREAGGGTDLLQQSSPQSSKFIMTGRSSCSSLARNLSTHAECPTCPRNKKGGGVTPECSPGSRRPQTDGPCRPQTGPAPRAARCWGWSSSLDDLWASWGIPGLHLAGPEGRMCESVKFIP